MEKSILNVIILAAGEGKRLRPLTNEKPKGLVELFGKSILERQIEIFMNAGITDISIVTGFNANMIKFPRINYFHNPNFKTTNMIETLFCAKEKLNESTIISYGDIIFDKIVLEKLIESKYEISVVVDLAWKQYWEVRFENPLEDAESLLLHDGYITNIGQKPKNLEQIQAQYIGLMKFQNNGIADLKEFYKQAKKTAETSTNPLNFKILFEQSYMTDLLQGMINFGHKLKAVTIEHGWLELDSFNDYELYNKLNKSNQLSKFIKLIKN
mgnify:CR=1 FL=1